MRQTKPTLEHPNCIFVASFFSLSLFEAITANKHRGNNITQKKQKEKWGHLLFISLDLFAFVKNTGKLLEYRIKEFVLISVQLKCQEFAPYCVISFSFGDVMSFFKEIITLDKNKRIEQKVKKIMRNQTRRLTEWFCNRRDPTIMIKIGTPIKESYREVKFDRLKV